jgi:hypothetical protein
VRADAEEGRVAISVADKADRCTVTVQHEKLADAGAVARWKAIWKERLAGLTTR